METRRQSLDTVNPAEGYITLLQNDLKKTFSIGQYFMVGRDPSASLSLPDPFVSSRHFKIEKTEKSFIIKDLKSKNGTLLNGAKIIEAHLKEGDLVSIGDIELQFSTKQPELGLPIELTSKNKNWSKQLEKLPQVAASALPALITGASGTGKELLSQWIHFNSQRKFNPLISVNCSALTENLVESELFGHVRGSFTGATNDRKGAFVAAKGGTLFLDEIGDLPLSLQPKLLRALENQEVKPVGSDSVCKTDVRMIAATHQNLDQLVAEGKFRSDLFYRLNVIRLQPPQLKDRSEDFEDILYRLAKEHRVRFSFNAITKLRDYEWPGNIRELKNLVLRASALFGKREIKEDNLHELIHIPEKPQNVSPVQVGNGSLLKEIEKELILKTLKDNEGNQRRTAAFLGIPKSTLHDKLKNYAIDLDTI